MDNLYNPVSTYYSNYKFNNSLPVIICSNYEDVLAKAKTVKTSCILFNKDKNVVSNKALTVNFTFDSKIEVVLVLNVELKGKSSLKIDGSNYTLSNIYLTDGDKSFKAPSFIVEISAENLKLVNFSLINFKCADLDKDYVCVKTSAKKFQMYNSHLNGKSNTGVFLRMDFPLNNYIKCCVFENFNKISSSNGGETIRLATSDYENQNAFCTIDQCYFNKCLGDPEVVSVKCSSNTIKNCVFENNDTSKLVLRHAHKTNINTCYFSGSGMRVYGTDHVIENIQLINNANILLDNKSGSSYVPAQNVKVNYVYYENVKTPVTNNGKNCTVTNVIKELKFRKEDLFTAKTTVSPIDPPVDPPVVVIIPAVVESNKIYKLNPELSDEQVKQIINGLS
jgi:hypothetical protein